MQLISNYPQRLSLSGSPSSLLNHRNLRLELICYQQMNDWVVDGKHMVNFATQQKDGEDVADDGEEVVETEEQQNEVAVAPTGEVTYNTGKRPHADHLLSKIGRWQQLCLQPNYGMRAHSSLVIHK